MRSKGSSKKKCKPATPPPEPPAQPIERPEPPVAGDAVATRQILEWMVAGHSDKDILEAVAATFPGRPADELLGRAVDHLAAAAKCPRDVLMGFALEAYRDLYRRLREIGDYQGAMKAVAALVKLSDKLPTDLAEAS